MFSVNNNSEVSDFSGTKLSRRSFNTSAILFIFIEILGAPYVLDLVEIKLKITF